MATAQFSGCSILDILGTVGLFAGQFPELLVDHCPSWAPAAMSRYGTKTQMGKPMKAFKDGGGYEKPDLPSLTFHHITARQ